MMNGKMKKLILLILLLFTAQYGLAGGCDAETDEEGNSDWIDVSYIGPRDDPGCRDNDPIARAISIYISNVVGDGPTYDHAYVVEPQPKKVISLALEITNLLKKLENNQSVTFYDYMVSSPTGDRSAVMNLQIEKRVDGPKKSNWLLTVNWPNTYMPSQHIWVPEEAAVVIFDVIWEQNSKYGFSTLNLFVETRGVDLHLIHPTKFGYDVLPMETHMGLVSAEQTPPVGDIINIREDLDP